MTGNNLIVAFVLAQLPLEYLVFKELVDLLLPERQRLPPFVNIILQPVKVFLDHILLEVDQESLRNELLELGGRGGVNLHVLRVHWLYFVLHHGDAALLLLILLLQHGLQLLQDVVTPVFEVQDLVAAGLVV